MPKDVDAGGFSSSGDAWLRQRDQMAGRGDGGRSMYGTMASATCISAMCWRDFRLYKSTLENSSRNYHCTRITQSTHRIVDDIGEDAVSGPNGYVVRSVVCVFRQVDFVATVHNEYGAIRVIEHVVAD